MTQKTSLVLESSIDADIIDAFCDLRKLRLEVLKKQLNDIPSIASILGVGCGLEGDVSSSLKEQIKEMLIFNIKKIEKRLEVRNSIYTDELDFYLDLLKETVRNSRKE